MIARLSQMGDTVVRRQARWMLWLLLCLGALGTWAPLALATDWPRPYVGPWSYAWATSGTPQFIYSSISSAESAGAANQDQGCGYTITDPGSFPTSPTPACAYGGSSEMDPLIKLHREWFNSLYYQINVPSSHETPIACHTPVYETVCGYRQREVKCPDGYAATDVSGDTVCIPNGSEPPQCPCSESPSNPIENALGIKLESQTDLVAGKGLVMTRYYASTPTWVTQTLGTNWRHSFEMSLSISPGPTSSVYSTVWAVRPNGQLIWFNVYPDGSVTHRPDVVLTLTKQVDGGGNTTAWTLVNESGDTETYSAVGVLNQLTLGKTDTLTFGYVDNRLDTVTDTNGRKLSFAYDSQGRVHAVTGPDGGAVIYGYDSGNNLTSATYPGSPSNPRTYLYEDSNFPHALTGILDENNNRYASWAYQSWYSNVFGRTIPRAITSVHGPLTSNVDKVTLSFGSSNNGVDTFATTLTTALGQTIHYTYGPVNSNAKFASMDARCVSCGFPWSAATYDSNGFVATKKEFQSFGTPGAVETDYTINANGLETQRIDSANYATTKRTTQTDWNTGFRVPTERRIYDASNVLVAKTSWTYNSRGQALTVTRTNPTTSATRTTSTAYCEAADVTAGTCPIVGLTKLLDGARTDVSDVTSYTYYQTDDSTCATAPTTCPHRKGDLWKITNALGQVTTFLKYDGAGRALAQTDINNVETDFTYSARGWLTQRAVRNTNNNTSVDDRITTYGYDNAGQVTSITQPDGSLIIYTYDGAHRLTDIEYLDSASPHAIDDKVHYVLDDAGNRIEEDTTDIASSTPKKKLFRDFNTLGQLATAYNADHALAHATTYTYDANGNPTQATDGLGTVTTTVFDPLNRVKTVIQDDGSSPHLAIPTAYTYDALDRATTVTDPQGLPTTYTYNGFGDLAQLDSPDTGTTTYSYDSGGNRTSQTDANTKTTNYSYDALNRPTGISYAGDSSLNVTYGYDSFQSDCPSQYTFDAGRLTRIEDGSGYMEFCFDRWGQLVRRVQFIAGAMFTTADNSFDKMGRTLQTTEPRGTVVYYTRDGIGRINGINYQLSGQSGQTTLVSGATFYPFGPVKSIAYGSGTGARTLNRTYDTDYRPVSIKDAATDGLDLNYTTDAAGDITRIQNTANTVANNYTYDPLYRLKGVTDAASTTVYGFTYDGTGNRTSKTYGGVTQNYTYPTTSHRLTNVGGTGGIGRTYDSAGNTLSIGTNAFSFVYSDANRLQTVKFNNVQSKVYTYDGRGERVRKTHTGYASETVKTIFDEAGHILGDFDNANNIIDEMIWMDDLPVGVVNGTSGTVNFIEPDYLGTPRNVISPSRSLSVWRWPIFNDPFGETSPNGDPDGDGTVYTLNLRFPGQEWDAESGLNYNYFRDYDSNIGRYLESDPIGLGGGIGTYSYVQDDPVGNIDPDGLQEIMPPLPEILPEIIRPIEGPRMGPGPTVGQPIDVAPIINPDDRPWRKKKRWKVYVRCNVTRYDYQLAGPSNPRIRTCATECPPPDTIGGWGYGNTFPEANANADHDANSNLGALGKRGCYPRHCQQVACYVNGRQVPCPKTGR